MKKVFICMVLALALLAASEPHVRERIGDAANRILSREQVLLEEDVPLSFADQLGGEAASDMLDVTLYYRFADTDMLGMEQTQLDIRREETVAWRIVDGLISGPSITHERLNGVFPQGTELISVSGEDTTAFVTLSSAFLGRPDGAPADWEDLPAWQEEAALRRRLAVQSVVLALTENARYQRVQLYVADSDDDIPQRIPLAWFDAHAADMTTVLAASPRDESMMLTPSRAMQALVQAWQAQDWAAMYPLLYSDSAEMPSLSGFEREMNELGVALLSSECSQGTISYDGQRATVVLDAVIRSAEWGDAQIIRESVTLERVDDNWAMSLAVLKSLMIRD